MKLSNRRNQTEDIRVDSAINNVSHFGRYDAILQCTPAQNIIPVRGLVLAVDRLESRILLLVEGKLDLLFLLLGLPGSWSFSLPFSNLRLFDIFANDFRLFSLLGDPYLSHILFRSRRVFSSVRIILFEGPRCILLIIGRLRFGMFIVLLIAFLDKSFVFLL